MRVKDQFFDGALPEGYEVVYQNTEGTYIELRDPSGAVWTGNFVAADRFGPDGRDYDFSVFDVREHLERLHEYERRPLISHLHDGSQRPVPSDSTTFFKKSSGSQGGGNPFKSASIEESLLQKLQRKVGKVDTNKFLTAIDKGIVGPVGESGIKRLSSPVGKYAFELKIGGSAHRLLGYVNEQGELIFDRLIGGGLH